jgi:hypothetical protein
MDRFGVFDVFDSATEERIGTLRRLGGWIGGYAWQFLDGSDQPLGAIEEVGLTSWRKVLRFFVQGLEAVMPHAFAFRWGDRACGRFEHRFALFRYTATLDLRGIEAETFDRRLAFAGALLLMAVESKEEAR